MLARWSLRTRDSRGLFLAPVDVVPLTRRWAPTDWWSRCAEHSPNAVAGWDLETVARLCAPVPHLVDDDRLVHTDLHADPAPCSATTAGPT